MKYLNKKDKKRRKLFIKNEFKQLLYKIGFSECRFDVKVRGVLFLALSGFIKDSYRSRIKNRCIYTYKGSSINRTFHISRLQIQYFHGKGSLSGVRKASW